jgi:hypothetical protein
LADKTKVVNRLIKEGQIMTMSTNLETKDIEQLLAEADELIRNVKSDAIKDIQEDHRLRCEIHARNLEILKSPSSG